MLKNNPWGLHSKKIKKALIDGEIVEYDECHPADREPYKELKEHGICLGNGSIYSIGGVRQSGPDNHVFYMRKTDENGIT